MNIQYNGCVWKGGRLRLEKAKEHYLLRLRREWAEDAAHVGTADSSEMTKNFCASKIPSSFLPSENKQEQLQIFFPRLRKVFTISHVTCVQHFLHHCNLCFGKFNHYNRGDLAN